MPDMYIQCSVHASLTGTALCLVQVPFDARVRISLDTNLAMILENPGDTPLALAHRYIIRARVPGCQDLTRGVSMPRCIKSFQLVTSRPWLAVLASII